MVEHSENAPVQDLLVETARSLLQYAGECYPWTPHEATQERQRIGELQAAQADRVRRLAQFLAAREPLVDFGTYPTDFGDFHYVSLDYLLGELVANQRRVVTRAEEALAALASDHEARLMLEQLLEGERETLAGLQNLSRELAPA